MKSSIKVKISTALCIIVLAFMACRDYEITTKINSDGSCERVMTVAGDSSEVVGAKFPTPVDSTWTLTLKKADKADFLYTATKKFENIAQMNAELYNDNGEDVRLNIYSTLEKRFRWFFTFLKYREEYQPLFAEFPISDHLTPKELEVLLDDKEENQLARKDSLDRELEEVAEEKATEWLKKCVFEEFLEIFLAGSQKLSDPTLTRELIISKKQELYEASDDDPDDPEDLLNTFVKVLKTPAVWKVAEIESRAFQLFDERLDFAISAFMDDYVIKINMPGLIIDTNAKNIEGNQVSWGDEDGDEIRIFYIGYEIWVESRLVNWWAVYVSLGIAFLLLFSIAATFRRGKN